MFTALVPPETVYTVANVPMIILRYVKFHPKTTDNIIAGAYMVIPAASPL